MGIGSHTFGGNPPRGSGGAILQLKMYYSVLLLIITMIANSLS
jgi:hypothetical protein